MNASLESLRCVDYLADLGRQADPSASARRAALLAAYGAIQRYERGLAETLIGGLLAIPGLKFYGIRDVAKLDRRCPTVAVRIAGHTPLELATQIRRSRFLYLGRQLLRPQSQRAARRGERWRLPAHRPGTLQHRRRSAEISKALREIAA